MNDSFQNLDPMNPVKFSLPPSWFFARPRDILPAYPPPASKSPFQIPTDWYDYMLDIRVPITIAAVYAITVHIMNHFASTSKPPKPYGIAKTKAFYWFVVVHNFFLAIYSGWTFVGITQAIARAIPSVYNEEGMSRTMHSLCKIHESDDMRGLWQEGLAFYGWLFYISKFYEVVDTAIILAKGRKSSTLQTYHHAGAMMCMWAGIRFMSPPIVVFVVFNSFIHTLMYTYYTLSTLHIPVPGLLKRSLTTLQISQFLIGGFFGFIQVFIEYLPPMSLASVNNVVDEVTAAGQQILGERKREFVHCLDNAGQVSAIIANMMYLTPLTYLFVMFFISTYTNKGKGSSKSQNGSIKGGKVANGKVANGKRVAA